MPMNCAQMESHRLAGGMLALLLSFLWIGLATPAQQADRKSPPKTRTDTVKDNYHGTEIADPYRWLEDQESAETRKWIDEQNQYTHSLLGPLPGRAEIEKRLGELLKIDSMGTPVERGGLYFYSKRLAHQELSVLYVRHGAGGEEQVLVDPHPMSPDRTVSVQQADVSDDGSLMMYTIRRGGADEVEVRAFDVRAKKDLPDRLPAARYFGVSLTPDNKGFYYTRHGAEGSRVRYHAFGTDVEKDPELFGSGYGPEKIIFAGLSEDGRHQVAVVLYGSAADQTEVYYRNLAAGGGFVPIVNDVKARFFPEFAGDTILLQTNWNAPKGRVVAVNPNHPEKENWREVIPESDAVIEGISAVGGKIFVNYTRNATTQVKIFEVSGKPAGELALPGVGSSGGLSGRWKSSEAFYSFTSFLTPNTIYRYNVATGKSEVWARLQVPFQSEGFEVKQVWFRSKDGTRVPMFVMHKKGLRLDGNNPVYLTGYGGFTVSLTPFFSSNAALWVERGGVYAVPNLRGGGEFGEEWHKAGMLDKKQNVFDDFIAAAEWLIANKYTRPSRLAIAGGSNGGLLVGAAVTQRPELFGAVVCSYPLLDMLRYHKFLVAQFWVPEYGSADNAAQFPYLRAYSPYQNVKAGTKYPAVLFVTGDADTRVAPLHARKMAALMQASTGSGKPVLLLYDTKAGHSGGRPVSKIIEDSTNEMIFLLWQLGMISPP